MYLHVGMVPTKSQQEGGKYKRHTRPVSSVAQIQQLTTKSNFVNKKYLYSQPHQEELWQMEETGSQPIPSQLTGNIGEQATPTDPGSIRKAYPEPHHWCRHHT